MIQAPVGNQVKFLIPELVEEIDPLAEPTVENAIAEDVLQDAIADGGVIVNAWDGRPYFRPKIHTGNLTINGTFDADTDWDREPGWTISAGRAAKAGGVPGDLSQVGRLVIGVVYEVTFTVSGYGAGSVTAKAGTAAGTSRSGSGTFIEDITCAGNTSIVFTGDATSVMLIDNVFYRPKSLWRIDTALQRRAEKQLDFAMVVTHNLHEVYQVSCENALRFFQNTADALPSDPLETTKTLYGLLGKPWPFISFDGINDKGVVANHADLNFGANTDFSLEIIFRTIMTGTGVLLEKGSVGGIDKRYNLSVLSGFFTCRIDDGTTLKFDFIPEVIDGEWHHGIGTFDRDGNLTAYIDGISSGSPINISSVGDIDDVTKSLVTGVRSFDLSSDPFDGDIALVRIWNRTLSAAEVALLAAGNPVPEADRWGSQTALSISTLENGGLGGPSGPYDTWDGQSATGFHAINLGGAVHGGTVDEVSFISGNKYAVQFTGSSFSGSIPQVTLKDALIGTDIGGGSQAAAEGSNFLEFTCDTTTTGVVEFFNLTTAELTIADFIVHQLGCALALESDGINSVFGKWFDKANQHHATLTGVDYWHVPDADNPAFFFQAFDSFNSRYLFTQFNELLETGQADTRLGWVIYGQMYGFNFATGGYQASKNWPGVRMGETDVGVILAEQKFGERPSWTVTLLAQDDAGWESIQDMLARITGPLYPFYIIWDYSHLRPVIWQVRLDPEVPFTYVTGSDPWQGITFGLKAE